MAETRTGQIRRLLAEQPVRVLREADEVVVDALAGLGQVSGRVLDGDGQVTEGSRKPPCLGGPPLILVPRTAARARARAGTRRRKKLMDSSSVKGGTSMLSASI